MVHHGKAKPPMSDLGQKETSGQRPSMSAIPPKADIPDDHCQIHGACCLRISSATVGTNGKKGTLMVVLTFEVPNF